MGYTYFLLFFHPCSSSQSKAKSYRSRRDPTQMQCNTKTHLVPVTKQALPRSKQQTHFLQTQSRFTRIFQPLPATHARGHRPYISSTRRPAAPVACGAASQRPRWCDPRWCDTGLVRSRPPGASQPRSSPRSGRCVRRNCAALRGPSVRDVCVGGAASGAISAQAGRARRATWVCCERVVGLDCGKNGLRYAWLFTMEYYTIVSALQHAPFRSHTPIP